MGIMYLIKRHLPLKVRLQLFHNFVQSHLNFCFLVWSFASKSLNNSLFMKQKQGFTKPRASLAYTQYTQTYV